MSIILPNNHVNSSSLNYITNGLIASCDITKDLQPEDSYSYYYGTYYKNLGKGFYALPQFDNTIEYKSGDKVQFNNHAYECLLDISSTPSTDPDSDSTHWSNISSQYTSDLIFDADPDPIPQPVHKPISGKTIEFYCCASYYYSSDYGTYGQFNFPVIEYDYPYYDADNLLYATMYNIGGFRNYTNVSDPIYPDSDGYSPFYVCMLNAKDEYSIPHLFVRFPNGTQYSDLSTAFDNSSDTLVGNTNINFFDFRQRPWCGTVQPHQDDVYHILQYAGTNIFGTVSIVIENLNQFEEHRLSFYINGQLKSSFKVKSGNSDYSNLYPMDIPPIFYSDPYRSIDPLNPKAQGNIGFASQGRTIMVRCYDRALTSSEILQNALSDKSRDNYVYTYDFSP